MNYTPEQIKIGKKLVTWLISQGIPVEVARKETAGILKRHQLKHIYSAMQQTSATSLSNLKIILQSKI